MVVGAGFDSFLRVRRFLCPGIRGIDDNITINVLKKKGQVPIKYKYPVNISTH